MKMNKTFKSCVNAGNWIGVGTAIGAAVFALTNEPVWIAVAKGILGNMAEEVSASSRRNSIIPLEVL